VTTGFCAPIEIRRKTEYHLYCTMYIITNLILWTNNIAENYVFPGGSVFQKMSSLVIAYSRAPGTYTSSTD